MIHTDMTVGAVPVSGTAAENRAGGTRASGFASVLQKAVSGSSGSLDDIFARASERYGVPLNLLKAVAKAESGFQADAVSSCGAQGIMQLMPSTARSLGVEDSFDPEQNVMGGAKYLSGLLNRYGDPKLALAAYNAGSGNVAKYGGIPPFAETRNYVEKVMRYAGGDVSVPSGTGTAGLSGLSGETPARSASGSSFTQEEYSDFLRILGQQLALSIANTASDSAVRIGTGIYGSGAD